MGCAFSSLEKKDAAARLAPPANQATALAAQRCLAEQSLYECLPPADDAHTGAGRAATKWAVFANTVDREKFISEYSP